MWSPMRTPPRSPGLAASDVDEFTELPFEHAEKACQGMYASPGPVSPRRPTSPLSRQSRSGPETFNIADDDPVEEREPRSYMSRVLAANEARKLVETAAPVLEYMKSLQTKAQVDIKRQAEEHATERCRIVEEARTRQMEWLAGAAQAVVVEQHRTLQAQVLRDAVIARQNILARAKTHAGMLSLVKWMFASFVSGALGVTVSKGGMRSARGRTRLNHSKAGFSRSITILIAITFVRHIWLNADARKLLVWSSHFGPFLRCLLSMTLQGTLRPLLSARYASKNHRQDAVERLVTNRPLLGPESAPDCWICRVGRNGQTFWHHTALGQAPWDSLSESPVIDNTEDTEVD
eukprot:TRINITY_DN69943_c0_g1_i1.p1 TRINITY_DN69943_c0_g1~~TRINITY_DN69943_c0_g1_i1.p1  ORF type:complete len:348 (+),score=40.14 TRINITY_DN69943_c0_g1_i1:62-1105(+)